MAKLSGLYAAALFELIMESGSPEEVLPQAVVLRNTLTDGDCRRVLVHPHIPAGEKREFFTGAFGGKLDAHLLAFISLVIDKNRETFAVPALNELIDMIRGHLRMTTAKVAAAAELSEEQAGALKKVLEEKLDKQVELIIKTDTAVIGGAHIQADGFFIDRTVKRQLAELKGAMSL
ncbi:MAG: ATP synthase F1 subunit delta [Oscillospiraceae bacterium]|nr:ATP synthase F1 subunit delta [Oscillospiraceae bacterium]